MQDAHPALPNFEYIKPDSFKQASQFLADHHDEARPLMGGTDIFVRMRDGVWRDRYLVDVKGLEGMDAITFDPHAGLRIGAAVNMNRVIASPEVCAHYPLLAQAARSVASYQLRTRATIVGNICNASPAGDTTGACMLLDGALEVQGIDGQRRESLQGFFLGPGKTLLNPGDIVSAIVFPPPPAGAEGIYIKLGRNQASDLAIVGVTAYGYPDPTTKSGYRLKLALASVYPTPLVVEACERILAEGPIDETTLHDSARAAMEACTPIDDVRAGARYRQLMARNLAYRALKEIWGKLQNGNS